MNFKKKAGRIWLENQNGDEIAFVAFPDKTAHTVEITSTVVNSSLRGQGVAAKLLRHSLRNCAARVKKRFLPALMHKNGFPSTPSRQTCWQRNHKIYRYDKSIDSKINAFYIQL